MLYNDIVASESWTSERQTRAGPARGERRVSEDVASQRRAREERALGERGARERGSSKGPGHDGAWIFDSSLRLFVDSFPTGT